MGKTPFKMVSVSAVETNQANIKIRPRVNSKNHQMCLQYSSERKTHLHTEKYAKTSVGSNKSSSNFKQRSSLLCQKWRKKNMDCGKFGGC